MHRNRLLIIDPTLEHGAIVTIVVAVVLGVIAVDFAEESYSKDGNWDYCCCFGGDDNELGNATRKRCHSRRKTYVAIVRTTTVVVVIARSL